MGSWLSGWFLCCWFYSCNDGLCVLNRFCGIWCFSNLCAGLSDRDFRSFIGHNIFSSNHFSNTLSHLRLCHTERCDDHSLCRYDSISIGITDQRQDARLIRRSNRQERGKGTVSARFNPFNHLAIKAQFHRATTVKLPCNHGCAVRFDPNSVKDRRSAGQFDNRCWLCCRCRFRRCFCGNRGHLGQISRCCGFRPVGALPNEISP